MQTGSDSCVCTCTQKNLVQCVTQQKIADVSKRILGFKAENLCAYDDEHIFRLGSYQLTIIERNSGVEYKGNSRVVEKSSLRIANMNSKGLSDCEFNLLKGVDRWCWGGE